MAEIKILNLIQNLRDPVLDKIMIYITSAGDYGIVVWWLAAMLLLHNKTRKQGLAVLAACGIEVFFCDILLKNAAARERPFTLNSEIVLLIKAPSDYSFPSGHTGLSFSAFFSLFFCGRKDKLWIPALIGASLIAFSRLYLYVHFPTDVLGGILIGLLCGKIGAELSGFLFRQIKRKRRPYPPAFLKRLSENFSA